MKSSTPIVLLLCLTLVIAMLPIGVFAEESDNFTFTTQTAQDNHVFIGGVSWKLLSEDDGKWLMISDEAIGGPMNWNEAVSQADLVYDGFSDLEKTVVMNAYKTETAESGEAYAPADLDGEKVFLPSASEVTTFMKYLSDRIPTNFWLRNLCSDESGNVGVVESDAELKAADPGEERSYGARYEFMMDLSAVADLIPAEGGRGYEANGSGRFGAVNNGWGNYKLAIHDPAMDEMLLTTNSEDHWSVVARPGESFVLYYNMLDFTANDYIFAGVCVGENMMYIASTKVDSSGNGRWILTLPMDDYNGGTLRLKVWRERINPDHETDYVGNAYYLPVSTGEETIPDGVLTRIAGANRYDTAIQAAESVKDLLSGPHSSKFSSVVIASGKDFPDALAGSYLAYVRGAPILLADAARAGTVAAYLRDNLNSDGKVYILGGTGAVPAVMETELEAVGIGSDQIVRLAGANRFATNIEILKEASPDIAAGIEVNVLVCSGKDYADALSASAVGWPILLVGDRLTDAQKEYITETPVKWYFHIIGGTAAVNSAVEAELTSLGRASGGGLSGRVFGDNRYATSRRVASVFFAEKNPRPDTVVLAYGIDFPDGLSGAPIAFCHRAPLVLATTSNIGEAERAAEILRASKVIVLGGPTLISDEAALKTVR